MSSVFDSVGRTASVISPPNSKVWPSGSAVTAAFSPTVLPPPGRFSMMIWPRLGESFWPISRAMTSIGPPAGNGTMIRTCRVGYRSCAAAGAIERGEQPAIAASASTIRIKATAFMPHVRRPRAGSRILTMSL